MQAIVFVAKRKQRENMVLSRVFGGRGRCLKTTTAQQYLSSNRTSQNVLWGGIKRTRLHLIFFEVALAIKCGSW